MNDSTRREAALALMLERFQESRDLLVGAYRVLGRNALAEIIDVHVAHRDLPSVDVLVAPQ